MPPGQIIPLHGRMILGHRLVVAFQGDGVLFLEGLRAVKGPLGQVHGDFGRLDLGHFVDAEFLRFVQPQPLAQLLGGIDALVQGVLGVAGVDLHQHVALLHEAAALDAGFGNVAHRVAAHLRLVVGGQAAGEPQGQVSHDGLDGLFADIAGDGLGRRCFVRPDALEIGCLGGRRRLGAAAGLPENDRRCRKHGARTAQQTEDVFSVTARSS